MREFFDRYAAALADLHLNDWSALNCIFASDDADDDDQHFFVDGDEDGGGGGGGGRWGRVHVKYCLAGFDDGIVEVRGADPALAHAMFASALARYVPSVLYVAGSDADCVFRFSAYAETPSGRGAIYTGHGFLEFDPASGRVLRLFVYSEDSHRLASLVSEELAEQQQQEAEEISC